MQSINHFFEAVLKAKCRNPRWSWGAEDEKSNRIFLRVWEDGIIPDERGERVQVSWRHHKPTSPGASERQRHLAAIRAGAVGYGVVCQTAPGHLRGDRRIKSFDTRTLLKLGEFIEADAGFYARIDERIPVVNLLPLVRESDNLIADIAAVGLDTDADQTTKDALIAARVGQGAFRDATLKLWDNKCAVTGSTTLRVVRASHIKPWRLSSNKERLDPHNGIPLVANLDALFDSGLISFDRIGRLIISPTLSEAEAALFDLASKSLRYPPRQETNAYLGFHRTKVFVK